MDHAQYDQFVDAINAAADLMGKRRPTELALSLYWKTLEQYHLQSVLSGISRHLQDPDTGMFMPKPADIIRQLEGGGDERSLKAWTKLEEAVKRLGSWKTIVFDDARIHAVITDMGGWMVFCTGTDKDWPFIRNEFCKRYRGYLQHQPTNYPALIQGEGNSKEPPVLVGDQRLAEVVMLAGGSEVRPTEIGTLASDFVTALSSPQKNAT